MPAARVPVAAVTVIEPLPVPDVEPSVSQAALSLAVHARVPPPAFVTVKVCVDGLPLPCVAVNVRLVGLTAIAGGGGGGFEVFEGATIWASPGISDINR